MIDGVGGACAKFGYHRLIIVVDQADILPGLFVFHLVLNVQAYLFHGRFHDGGFFVTAHCAYEGTFDVTAALLQKMLSLPQGVLRRPARDDSVALIVLEIGHKISMFVFSLNDIIVLEIQS